MKSSDVESILSIIFLASYSSVAGLRKKQKYFKMISGIAISFKENPDFN